MQEDLKRLLRRLIVSAASPVPCTAASQEQQTRKLVREQSQVTCTVLTLVSISACK